MRACVDTNILISYLLSPLSVNPPARLIRGALRGEFSLVIAETTLSELKQKVQSKRYLVDRISAEFIDQFVDTLRVVSEIFPLPPEPLPRVVRDSRDDLLLAPAVLEQVDYLVTGDKDLLVLAAIKHIRIVDPADFLGIFADGVKGGSCVLHHVTGETESRITRASKRYASRTQQFPDIRQWHRVTNPCSMA